MKALGGLVGIKKKGGNTLISLLLAEIIWQNTYVYDLARKKDSLRVKWRHTYMKKDKSIWIFNCGQSASWTLWKILKLKDQIQLFIKYELGNGKDIFVWLDNWHSIGPRVKRAGS